MNTKCKTIKFIEDNMGELLDDLGYSDTFLHIRSKTTHEKNNLI